LTPVYTAGTGGSASYNTSILSALPNATYTVQVTESGSGCTTTAVATINCSVLPVKLLKFAVAKEANIHLLTWLTASEQNVSHFEVEYSSDGIFFEMISKQQAAGESTTLKTYFFEQQQAQTGRSYYRLKIMDNDGRYEYSDIIMVVGEESRRIIAYPNPSADFFRLEGLEKDAYNATLTNIFGQKTDIRIEHRQINLKDMPSGIYYLQIREGSATQTLRLVKYAD
jgi:trimeric autotransporter adhesin